MRSLHPEPRRKVWSAIQLLRSEPVAGRSLREELEGLWRFPVGRLRIVYRFDDHSLELVAIGKRSTIYEDLARRVSRKAEGPQV